jgi:acyl-CoA synthetase (AMP-forming)/AMP-acid ligase II
MQRWKFDSAVITAPDSTVYVGSTSFEAGSAGVEASQDDQQSRRIGFEAGSARASSDATIAIATATVTTASTTTDTAATPTATGISKVAHPTCADLLLGSKWMRGFRTGDLGFVDVGGMLYLQGRADTTVNLNGYCARVF